MQKAHQSIQTKAHTQQHTALLDQLCFFRSLVETDQKTVDAIAARLSLVREHIEKLVAEMEEGGKHGRQSQTA